jgi:tetratricopeptide (TPR) repeat protein
MFRAILLLTALLQATAGGQTPAQSPRDLVLVPNRPTARVPRGYALIIGVGTYPNLEANKQLRYSESDADAIYRVLISAAGGAFPAENVKFLKGPAATLANIRRELEVWLPSVAQPADRVVVYFAGHGFVKDGKGYLAPTDVVPDRLAETAYSMGALGDALSNKVKAGWKVLFTDACHSDKINAETTDEALEQQFNALPASFLTLTATTEREQSFEDPNLATGFGIYSYFLVRGLQGNADYDPCDGRITADELIEYVRSNVRRYARERQLTQTPTARGDYEPEMLLGVGTSCLATGGGPEARPLQGTAIVETNVDDVTVYVDGKLIGVVSKAKPLSVPGLSSGVHEFRGEKSGYQPDRKEVLIAPGQDTTITLRIRYAREIKKQARDLNEQGEKLLYSRRSSMNLANILPTERTQSPDDLKKARTFFERALAEETNYGLAAFHLGQTCQLLLQFDDSVKFLRRAVEIDATDIDARTQLAAVLIERGDPDEAVRELNEVLRIEPKNDEAYSMLARAYWDKSAWLLAIEQADKALALNASNAQAHLWKADALRQRGAEEKDATRQLELYASAREGYRNFLQLTNFSSGFGARLAFHLVGFGVGSRAHADRQGSYERLRVAGFLGLCLSEGKVGNPLRAREYCERALKYAPNDPIAHFLLGNANRDIFNSGRASCDYLRDARASYARMLAINPDLDESKNARNYLTQIDQILPKLGCKA